MNRLLHGVARAMAESFDLPGPILEIGSYQVPGQESIGDLRGLFPGREYIGLDMRAGPGVDLVGNVESLPRADASVGTVIAFSAFEHVRKFWVGFDQVHRVLRPDGVFLVACPFYFHVHAYPSDYWRFTPEAFDFLLESYPTRVLGWSGPERRPQQVWAAAFRERAIAPTEEQFERYRRLLGEYAREPLSLGRRIRYGLGRAIAGRRPFAPYFDRERCITEVRTSAALDLPQVPSIGNTSQSRVA